MHSAVNLQLGNREDRSLMCMSTSMCGHILIVFYSTGVHTVADVYCMGCNERVGWYYHKASDFSQKYKEGEWVRGHRLPSSDAGEQASTSWSERSSLKRMLGPWMLPNTMAEDGFLKMSSQLRIVEKACRYYMSFYISVIILTHFTGYRQQLSLEGDSDAPHESSVDWKFKDLLGSFVRIFLLLKCGAEAWWATFTDLNPSLCTSPHEVVRNALHILERNLCFSFKSPFLGLHSMPCLEQAPHLQFSVAMKSAIFALALVSSAFAFAPIPTEQEAREASRYVPNAYIIEFSGSGAVSKRALVSVGIIFMLWY